MEIGVINEFIGSDADTNYLVGLELQRMLQHEGTEREYQHRR